MIEKLITKYALAFDGVKEKGVNEGWEHIYFHNLNMSFQERESAAGSSHR